MHPLCHRGCEECPCRASVHLHGQPCVESRPAGADPADPGYTSGFAKRSVFKLPVFGYCLKLGGFIPVDRKGNKESAQESIAAAQRLLDKGLHITTFVEGTRSQDGRLLVFKKGPFYLAEATGAPCIPASIYGTESSMAKGSFGIKPGTAHIVFHEPIKAGDFASREDLMQAARTAIASGLPEWMRG